jgi:glycerophosphoryl diester phosphodiesterase
LEPEYIFCNYRMIPDDASLWKGPWRWALYEIIDPEIALALAAHGAHLVETMAIKEMMADQRLRSGACRE